jgi:sterol desaturase/sphingolipid hydroxylase (fatty acid hydroxylase superfamily)
MQATDLLLYAGIAVYPMLFVAERLFPARTLPPVTGWHLIGVVFFSAYIAIGIHLPAALPAAWYESSLLPGAQLGVAGGAVVGLLVLTLVNYAWHRAVHRFNPMWRLFHQMHHSARRLDVSGSMLFHPTEMVAYTLLSVFVTTIVLGLDPLAASIVGFVLSFNAVFQHSNIATPRGLRFVVQRPEAHSMHHAYGVHAFNYSDLPLWDLVFGTYRDVQGFMPRVGFAATASRRLGAMAVFRDVHPN